MWIDSYRNKLETRILVLEYACETTYEDVIERKKKK